MTYLELVNKVMRRIREPVVGSIAENFYSALIGEFVNDAKRAVEDSWSWRALIDACQITTVPGTATYNLVDFNCLLSGQSPRENARLYIESDTGMPLIRVTTDNEESYIMKAGPFYDFVERARMANDASTGKPDRAIFGVNIDAASGESNLSVTLVPTPDAIYNVQVYLVNPQNDLSDEAEVLLIPSFPVVQLAYLYALYERGEEIGESLTLTSNKANAALSDAISFDSSMTSELVFRPD